MKKTVTRCLSLATLIIASPITFAADGFSSDVGLVSDYYFRANHIDNATAFGSLDYNWSGLHAGLWTIYTPSPNVNDSAHDNGGFETHFNVGYGLQLSKELTLAAGYTRYEYSYSRDFEQEANVGIGYKGFALDLAYGQDSNKGSFAGKTLNLNDASNDSYNYAFYALSWNGKIFGASIGGYNASDIGGHSWDLNERYTFLEVSAGTDVLGMEMRVTVGDKQSHSDEFTQLMNNKTDTDGYIFLSLKKTFAF